MKAFFKAAHLRISKTLRYFFYISTCGMILFAYALTYSGLGYKQDWKQSIVIDADYRNEIIFRDYGGFVVNLIDAPLTIVIAFVLITSEGSIAAIIVIIIFTKWTCCILAISTRFRLLITLRSRRMTISQWTHNLQLMLIRIFILHIVIFVSLYVLPVIVVFIATYFHITNISKLVFNLIPGAPLFK